MLNDAVTESIEFLEECCQDHHPEVRRMAEDCLKRQRAQQEANLSDALFLLGVSQF
jgi:hypothetical protein